MGITGSNGRAELSVEDGVAHVRLTDVDRKNCFSIPMGEDLVELYTEIESREDVVSVSFTAEGGVFCAGLDLEIVGNPEERADDLEYMLDIFEPAREWLRHCPYPTVVGAQGVAPGAGAALANAADIVVAAEDLQIWWPEINVGIPPYTLGPRLLRQVGHRRATELTLMGWDAKLSAEEARELGIVNRIVPTDSVTKEARWVAETLAETHHEHGTVLDVYETIQAAGRRADGSDVLAGWKGERREWF